MSLLQFIEQIIKLDTVSSLVFISVHLRVIMFQCHRKERKAIQPLGADLHRHKPGRPMLNHPSFIIAALKLCKIINATHATKANAEALCKKCIFLPGSPYFMPPCQEPTYDERLTWEGRSDKMVQV